MSYLQNDDIEITKIVFNLNFDDKLKVFETDMFKNENKNNLFFKVLKKISRN